MRSQGADPGAVPDGQARLEPEGIIYLEYALAHAAPEATYANCRDTTPQGQATSRVCAHGWPNYPFEARPIYAFTHKLVKQAKSGTVSRQKVSQITPE